MECISTFWVEVLEPRKFPWGFEVLAAVYADERRTEHLRTLEIGLGKDVPDKEAVAKVVQGQLDRLRAEMDTPPAKQDDLDKEAAIETLKRLKIPAEEITTALARV